MKLHDGERFSVWEWYETETEANLAMTGKLTDKIPDCMSLVIGYYIIDIQDKMPDDLRNSKEWRELFPLAAGTGREREKERLEIILAWMWELLKGLQDHADKNGYGAEWRRMCEERTEKAAYNARLAAINNTDTDAVYVINYVIDTISEVRAASDINYYDNQYGNPSNDGYIECPTNGCGKKYATVAVSSVSAKYAIAAVTYGSRKLDWCLLNPVSILRKLCQDHPSPG